MRWDGVGGGYVFGGRCGLGGGHGRFATGADDGVRPYTGAFQICSGLGLAGFPVLKFLRAGFFFHDLAFALLRDPGVVGEIDLCGLIEVGVVQGWGETVD